MMPLVYLIIFWFNYTLKLDINPFALWELYRLELWQVFTMDYPYDKTKNVLNAW
jgi:hypothetical protein